MDETVPFYLLWINVRSEGCLQVFEKSQQRGFFKFRKSQ